MHLLEGFFHLWAASLFHFTVTGPCFGEEACSQIGDLISEFLCEFTLTILKKKKKNKGKAGAAQVSSILTLFENQGAFQGQLYRILWVLLLPPS